MLIILLLLLLVIVITISAFIFRRENYSSYLDTNCYTWFKQNGSFKLQRNDNILLQKDALEQVKDTMSDFDVVMSRKYGDSSREPEYVAACTLRRVPTGLNIDASTCVISGNVLQQNKPTFVSEQLMDYKAFANSIGMSNLLPNDGCFISLNDPEAFDKFQTLNAMKDFAKNNNTVVLTSQIAKLRKDNTESVNTMKLYGLQSTPTTRKYSTTVLNTCVDKVGAGCGNDETLSRLSLNPLKVTCCKQVSEDSYFKLVPFAVDDSKTLQIECGGNATLNSIRFDKNKNIIANCVTLSNSSFPTDKRRPVYSCSSDKFTKRIRDGNLNDLMSLEVSCGDGEGIGNISLVKGNGEMGLKYRCCKASLTETEPIPKFQLVSSSYDAQLNIGKSLTSPNGRSEFKVTNTGLDLQYDAKSIWRKKLALDSTAKLVLEDNGQLVLYNGGNKVWFNKYFDWSANGPYRFSLEDNGNAAVYDSLDKEIWSTGSKVL